MSKIELRLSDVEPPLPEPKRTIYRDIVNLPDPVKLGLTIRYFNHDDVGLYFQITGSGTGYTFGTVNLGLLASGADAYQNLDEFASRAKPSVGDLPNGEKEENITLTLKAYTDSGYSNLKWTYERIVTVHWINSADAAFTVDVLNDFSDGVQGWAIKSISNVYGTPSVAVATDYVLSTPYSLKATWANQYNMQGAAAIYKSFTTPNKDTIFAVADVRVYPYLGGATYGDHFQSIQITKDGDVLVYLGNVAGSGVQVPEAKWMRIVVPLPKNTTLEFRIVTYGKCSDICNKNVWLDDFKILSK